jgi:hypothetical protein
MRKWLVMAVLTAAAAACAQQTKNIWVRMDGQYIRENPAFTQKFEVDRLACTGETQKANLSGSSYCGDLADCVIAGVERDRAMSAVAQGCMADRGYALVPENQAVARAAEFRARQQAIATAVPTKPKQ